MFGSWLNGIPKNYKSLVLVGAAALCWSVWLFKNVVIFEYKHSSFSGNMLDYTLAPYLNYPLTAYFLGGACCGISVLGAGGQGFFYLGT